MIAIKTNCCDFLDGPVVKTSTSNAGSVGLIPDLRAMMPHDQKSQNIKQVVLLTDSIKSLLVHIKKKKSNTGLKPDLQIALSQNVKMRFFKHNEKYLILWITLNIFKTSLVS